MNTNQNRNIKYFSTSSTDEAWGIVVTTVGSQLIPPNSSYPRSQHPTSHVFNPQQGRILKEYQIIYISEGKGWFESKSCKKQPVKAGTIIMLFPDEWHTYEPEKETGWFEYWIGFKGEHIDGLIRKGFFSPQQPIFNLGYSSSIVNLYNDAINHALQEKRAYQQIISSIVFYILGTVYYKYENETFNDSFAVNKINEAKAMMKQEIGCRISPEDIARNLGVGYSWFRKMFKLYTNISPAQYQANLIIIKAKELLDITELNITDISYQLGFENVSQFSTFFRRKTGVPPLQYRKEGQHFKKPL